MHMGRPFSLRQRREDMSHEWTLVARRHEPHPRRMADHFVERDDNQLPSGPELCPAFVRPSAAGSADAVELPCLFSFDHPVCRELALSLAMVAEAQAHGPAARMYVEVLGPRSRSSKRLLSRSQRPVAPAPRPGLSPGVWRRAKEFLHDQMNRNPGVTELSAAVGMNVDHFSRMFKRSTGLAPHQYLGNIRLERAKLLLAEGRASISIQIANEIGYTNPSQFSAFFRKRTGLSPTEFRRSVLTAYLSSISRGSVPAGAGGAARTACTA